MVYCVSDIHGCFDAYLRLLEALSLSENDSLYVLGDMVDRGPHGIRVLQDMMNRPNVFPLLGNHEFMAAWCMRFLTREITDESLADFERNAIQGFQDWFANGGMSTLSELKDLSHEELNDILSYLGECAVYEEISVGDSDYLLVHAGLAGFSPDKPLDDYYLFDLIETRPDYSRVCFPDRFLVTGHTPTRLIPDNPRPDRIYRANRHIALDCGCVFGGCLGAICLDTGEEFYV